MARIPTTVQAAYTPNPEAIKFIVNNYIMDPGATAEFESAEEAIGKSKLATELFQFPYVSRVFIAGNFVTVTKNNSAHWDFVLTEIRDFIRNFISEGNMAVYELPENKPYKPNGLVDGAEGVNEPSELDSRIRSLMKQYVAPTVAQDGGEIIFLNFKNGVVTVRLKGACHQCPASNNTLKNGIEKILKKHLPEVIEVVAEDGFQRETECHHGE